MKKLIWSLPCWRFGCSSTRCHVELTQILVSLLLLRLIHHRVGAPKNWEIDRAPPPLTKWNKSGKIESLIISRSLHIETYLFFGMENQYSGRSLFLPYDITVGGKGVVFPSVLPILKRKYIGGSWHARAGRGMSSENFSENFFP